MMKHHFREEMRDPSYFREFRNGVWNAMISVNAGCRRMLRRIVFRELGRQVDCSIDEMDVHYYVIDIDCMS